MVGYSIKGITSIKGTSINCLRPLRDLKRAVAKRKPKAKAGCPWRGLQRGKCMLQVAPCGAYRRQLA